jgi:hypothetical protein
VHDLTINFAADFNNPSGLGRHARCFGAALTNRARVRPLPLRRPEPVVHDDAPPLRPALWDTAGVGICVATPDLLRTVPGVVQIFSTVWDTTRLPPYYVEHIKQADQVWVPTAWGRDLFVGSGMDGNRNRRRSGQHVHASASFALANGRSGRGPPIWSGPSFMSSTLTSRSSW